MRVATSLKAALIVVCLAVALASPAMATLLVEYQGTSYIGATNQNEVLAKVVVGASDVTIGSFGVYGQAQTAGNIKWVIFDKTQASSPVYLSAAQAVSANPGTFATKAQWYDSPTMNFTLLANHTYAMGVLADKVGTGTFYWGSAPDSPFGGGPGVSGGGLTLPFMQSLANAGVVSGAFVNNPYLYFVDNSNRRETSLRVYSPPPAPVPLPGAVFLLGPGLAAVVALRRRFKK